MNDHSDRLKPLFTQIYEIAGEIEALAHRYSIPETSDSFRPFDLMADVTRAQSRLDEVYERAQKELKRRRRDEE